MNLNPRTLQRWKKISTDQRRGPLKHAKKLSQEESANVIELACREEFMDLSPHKVVAKLVDQGKYVASESTFYRLLKGQNLLAHRSRAKKPKRRTPIETIATRPNEVWVWDITNLRSRTLGHFYKLYLFEDLYSRKIVGWDILETHLDGDAVPIFEKALLAEGIDGKFLRLHADNGNPMRGASMLYALLSLGVRPSFSRPSVSNDNPHIESLFRTMKYTPAYPTKPFASIESAKEWVGNFVNWYNNSMHSRLAYVTPNQRHIGEDEVILAKRREVYADAKAKNPARWSKAPKSWSQPKLAKLSPYGTRMAI